MDSLKTSTDETCPQHQSFMDVQCPICLSILIEPVTLPCNHELCMPCFKESFDKIKLCCPLCRRRISSWVRRASRQNGLINQKRWNIIKDAYPEQVERRLAGLELSYSQEFRDFKVIRRFSQPGDIRKEYEIEKKRIDDEKAKLEEINEQSFWEFMKNSIDEDIKVDESSVASTSKVSSKISPVSQVTKSEDDSNPVTSTGSITDYPSHSSRDSTISDPEILRVDSLSSARSPGRSTSQNSNDSISPELCHFKPIKIAPKTPPKPQPDGRVVEPRLVLSRPRNLSDFLQPSISTLEPCVPLRRKLSLIDADRIKKRRKTETIAKSSSPVPSTSFENLSSSLLDNADNEPLNLESNDKNKDEEELRNQIQILPLEPDIPLSHQTSTYGSPIITRLIGKIESAKDNSSILLLKDGVKKSEEVQDKVNLDESYLKDVQNIATRDETVAQIVEQQVALMNKLKQEEADWKLAQSLQRGFDMEFKSRRIVREPYQLRKRQIAAAVPVGNGGQRRKHI